MLRLILCRFLFKTYMETTKKRNALTFIFITLLIDFVGWGIIIPVMPDLIGEIMHVGADKAAEYGGSLIAAYAFTQFLFAPLVGNLSDKFGRRPIILISLVGFALDYVFLYFASSLSMLFIGRIIAGITGASITPASAFIADVSTHEDRAKNFGLIGVAFGMGFVIGPVIGGFLGSFGIRIPFLAAALLCLLNFIYGYFALPESLKPENRRAFDWKRANPLGTIVKIRKYPELKWLIIAMILMYMAAHAVNSNWSFFTKYQFDWNERMIGISLGVVGVLTGLVQGILIRWLNPKLGNQKSIYLGLSLYAIGLVLFAFSAQEWMMFVFLVPYCLGGIAGPALQAVISSKVPSNEQGELQGILASLMSGTAIIGPLLMTRTFSYFSGEDAVVHFPGASFLLGSLFMALAAFLAYYTFSKGRMSGK